MKRKYREIYQALVSHHVDDAYRYFCRWGLSPAEAEDCVQESFLQAWKSIKTYREEASPRVWLLSICRRVAWRSSQARRKEFALREEAQHEPPAQREDGFAAAEQRDGLRLIATQMEKLSDAHQEVLYLHYLHELTEPEIARLLGIPKGTVHGRLRVARKQLRIHCQSAQRGS